jgi:hypothetical protein
MIAYHAQLASFVFSGVDFLAALERALRDLIRRPVQARPNRASLAFQESIVFPVLSQDMDRVFVRLGHFPSPDLVPHRRVLHALPASSASRVAAVLMAQVFALLAASL